MLSTHRYFVALALGSTALTLAAPAAAQTQTTEGASTGAQLDSAIVVTARRREERLMDVPAAITVLNTADLQAKGITNPTDLIHAVPSLQQSASGFGNAVPHFVIRGQRQQLEFIQSDQSVGVYVDEVVVPRQQGLNAGLFDMANVQVLKGPQGTLFGKNQTAGAILFTSQMPKSDFEGFFSATVGNYDARKIEGAINIPITEDFQIRAAGQINRRDGYVHNLTDDRYYHDLHSDAWRVSAHYAPAGVPIENWLIVSGAQENEIGSLPTQPSKFIGRSGGPTGTTVGTSILFAALSGCGQPPPNNAFCNRAGDQLLSAAVQAQSRSFGDYDASGISQYQLANGNNTEIDTFSVTNKTELQISDDLTLRNIFGYRFLESYTSGNFSGVAGILYNPGTNAINANASRLVNPVGPDGVPQPAGNIVCGPQSGFNCVLATPIQGMNFTKQRQVSDEVTLLGKALDGKLDFIVGGYYFREHGVGVTSSMTTIATGNRYGTAQNTPANESKAVFGQFTVRPFSTLAITGGLRQTWDKRETNAKSVNILKDYWQWNGGIIPADGVYASCSLIVDTGPLPNNACLLSGTAKFDALTYTASVDWHPTPDILVYGATRKGYRSGGYNQSATVNTTAGPTVLTPFRPETVVDYEIGFKGNWRFDNGMAASFNIDYYYNKYDDIQRALTASVALGSKSVTRNAAKATIKGVEVEARFEPTPWLELTGYYSYIKAQFKSFIVAPDISLSPASVGDFTNANFSGVPSDSGGATITVHSELPGDKGRVAATVDYFGQTGTYMQDNNVVANTSTPIASDFIPGYWLLGANISWTNVMGKPFDISANVRNLNKKVYYTGGVDGTSGGLATAAMFLGEPRMFTFNLTYHF